MGANSGELESGASKFELPESRLYVGRGSGWSRLERVVGFDTCTRNPGVRVITEENPEGYPSLWCKVGTLEEWDRFKHQQARAEVDAAEMLSRQRRQEIEALKKTLRQGDLSLPIAISRDEDGCRNIAEDISAYAFDTDMGACKLHLTIGAESDELMIDIAMRCLCAVRDRGEVDLRLSVNAWLADTPEGHPWHGMTRFETEVDIQEAQERLAELEEIEANEKRPPGHRG